MKRILNKKLCKGFTLMELMAAMTITTILVVIIVGLTRTGVDIWKKTINDIRTTALARQAMDVLYSDLGAIQMRSGNSYEWLLAENDRDLQSGARRSGSSDMKMGPEGAEIVNASRLIFFTSAIDRNPAILSADADHVTSDYAASKATMGDINCVGYKLEYRDQILNRDASEDGIGFPVYSLYRNLIPADKTYEDILSKDNLYQAYSRLAANETDSINFIAENIIEMTLVFEVEYDSGGKKENDGSTATREVETVPLIATGYSKANAYRKVSILGNQLRVERQGSSDSRMNYGNIVGLSVSLTVVTDEGMAIIDEVRKGKPAPDPKKFFAKYTKGFSQRINIPKPN